MLNEVNKWDQRAELKDILLPILLFTEANNCFICVIIQILSWLAQATKASIKKITFESETNKRLQRVRKVPFLETCKEMAIVDSVIRSLSQKGRHFGFFTRCFVIEAKRAKTKNTLHLCDTWSELFADKNSSTAYQKQKHLSVILVSGLMNKQTLLLFLERKFLAPGTMGLFYQINQSFNVLFQL